MYYTVIIKCNTARRKSVRCILLKKLIFLSWERTGRKEGEYRGRIPGYRFEPLARALREIHVPCYIDNSYGRRSTTYRREFFERIKPAFGDYYFCSYCGKPVRKNRITVDHLYPVHEARKNIRLQKMLKRRGIHSINDPKNLVPACQKCNQAKSSNMGAWIRKGKIGRIQWLWFVRHAIRIIVVMVIIGIAWIIFR